MELEPGYVELLFNYGMATDSKLDHDPELMEIDFLVLNQLSMDEQIQARITKYENYL